MYFIAERMAVPVAVNVPWSVTNWICVTRPLVLLRERMLMAVTLLTGLFAKSPTTRLICAIVHV